MTVLYNELQFSCRRELSMMLDLLNLYNGSDLNLTPVAFSTFGELKRVGFSPNSGYVWLEDEDYNRLMINKGKLDLYITTPYDGHEGFLEDLLNLDFETLNEEDQDFLLELKNNV